jgi:moderate conductance mechanosensitive channel
MYIILSRFASAWDNVPKSAQQWIVRNYVAGLRIVLIILITVMVNRYIGKLMKKFLNHVVRADMYSSKTDRDRRLNTLSSLLTVVIHFIVWVVSFILIITQMGVNAAPAFASAGLIGAGLAFGAQSVVRDFLAGVFIISENQYRLGDIVEVMGVSGTVQSIGLRTTVLRDLSGSVHHIPNGSIVVVTNKTVGYGQINLDISVVSDTDIDLLEHEINHAGQRLANRVALKDSIIDPPKFSRISELTGVGMTVKIIGKTIGGAQLDVKSAFLIELKRSFAEHKIKLAIPILPTAQKKKK